jgi:hypothetical protein
MTNLPILTTHSGVDINVAAPNFEHILIEDIAHALSMTCRYGGHCDEFYSVADHCLNMYNYFMNKDQLVNAYIALMHDATEAYLCDIPRPIKPFIVGYQEMEDNLAKVINKKFKVPEMTDDVKVIDYHIIYNEVFRVSNHLPVWLDNYENCGVYINVSQTPKAAKMEFLEAFDEVRNILDIV